MVPANGLASLLEMAEVFQRLAEEQERATDLRQQQQIQPKDGNDSKN